MFPSEREGHSQAQVKLADAARLMELLTESATLELDRLQKVRWLLENIAPIVREGLDYHILLLDQLDRDPFPRMVDRVTYGPTLDLIEPRDDQAIQSLLDLCGPMCDITLEQALRRLRVPTTYIYSADSSARWFARVFKPNLLHPNLWQDCMAAYWAGSESRLIIFNAFLPSGYPPFTEKEEQLLSLACRAVAPVMDMNLFVAPENCREAEGMARALNALSEELRPLLLVVLQGQSAKQIAQIAGLRLEQVDLALERLYAQLGVQSRGQLMAKFVDQHVLAWLEQSMI